MFPLETAEAAEYEEVNPRTSRPNRVSGTMLRDSFPNCARAFDWARSSRVPFKLVCHLLLLVTMTVQLLVDNGESDYLRSSRRSWYHFFFPEDFEQIQDYEPVHPHFLYTSDDVYTSVKSLLEGYETIREKSLDTIYYIIPNLDGDESSTPGTITDPDEETPNRDIKLDALKEYDLQLHAPSATLRITKFTSTSLFDPSKAFDSMTQTSIYSVNSTYLGPLDEKNTLKELLRRVVEMVVSFNLVTIDPLSLRRSCLVWQIDISYSFQNRGQMHMLLDDKILRDCDDTTSSAELFADLRWVNLILIVLCVVYFFALVRDVTQRYHSNRIGLDAVFENSRVARCQVMALGLARRVCAFCDFWVFSDLVCTTCILLGSFINIYYNAARKPTGASHSVIVGLGNCLVWINLVQYFSHNKTYFALILTLERSVPRVAKFLLGVAPIFMGYAVFGVAYFGGKTVRFSSLFNAFVTLFSLLNGDAISETFHELITFGSLVAQIYLYTFILLWTYVVLNILIAIVEESFFTSLWNSTHSGDDVDKSAMNNPRWFRARRIPTYKSAPPVDGADDDIEPIPLQTTEEEEVGLDELTRSGGRTFSPLLRSSTTPHVVSNGDGISPI